MRTALSLAVIGSLLAAAPAFARGMQDQSSGVNSMDQPYNQSQNQSSSSSWSGRHHQRGQQSSMNQETIRDVQQKLQSQGYKVGQVDGRLGPSTKSALKQFQQDQGLPATGQLNQQTASALGVESGGATTQQAQTPEQQGRMRGGQMNQSEPAQPPIGGRGSSSDNMGR
jgi:peptidoglycan hydrolase-like protein with peptidoglycan-binding domain